MAALSTSTRATATSTSPVGRDGFTVSAQRATTVALESDHVLRAQRLGRGVRLARHGRVEDELHHAAAVAQVDEDRACRGRAGGPPSRPGARCCPRRSAAARRGRRRDSRSRPPACRPQRRTSRRERPAPRRPRPPLRRSRTRAMPGSSHSRPRSTAPLRVAAAGLLELALGAAAGQVELDLEQQLAAQLLRQREGPPAQTFVVAHEVGVRARPRRAHGRAMTREMRSRPVPKPTPGVGGPPICSTRPS